MNERENLPGCCRLCEYARKGQRKVEQTADNSHTCKVFLSQLQTCRHMPVGHAADFSKMGTGLVKMCKFKELWEAQENDAGIWTTFLIRPPIKTLPMIICIYFYGLYEMKM